MLEVSATLVFLGGVVVGAILGAIGICIVAITWKGDNDGRQK